jgi:predicted DNA-binding WGR domain protein
MPDELRSPIKHHLVLHRIDPEQGIRRFYSLMIERDLFGTVRLVRNWGRIGTNGQELAEVFADAMKAGKALEAVADQAAAGLSGSLIRVQGFAVLCVTELPQTGEPPQGSWVIP